jgi:hypothetical protein
MSAKQKHAPVDSTRMDFCGPEVQVVSVLFALTLLVYRTTQVLQHGEP